jgi:hypothetical protein
MRYYRAVFLAGVAVGYIAGSRAGRERYDQIVKHARTVAQSPPVRRAGQAASDTAKGLYKSAAAKAADVSRSAASQAPKTAASVARTAKDRAGKVSMPKVPTPRVPRLGNRFGGAHPDQAAKGSQHTVNSNGHGARQDED